MTDLAGAHLHEAEFHALLEGRHGDPFALLGPHRVGDTRIVRVLLPNAHSVEAVDAAGRILAPLERVYDTALFVGEVKSDYLLRIRWPDEQLTEDPYSFGPLLGEMDLHLIGNGDHRELYRVLGAHVVSLNGVPGVRFAVWAPNARRVSVVGDFNAWDGRRHAMRRRDTGVWEIFVPRAEAGAKYKYEILGPHGVLPLKSDPVAAQVELPPGTASIVVDPRPFVWTDSAWMASRAARHRADAPISIYEVHAASWRRHGTATHDWDRLAEELVPYVKALGFTHLELLPMMGHPFGGSWGYQPLSLFAPHAEYGAPAGFARFVDRCHAAGIGVLLDWVPAHFPTDVHGLAKFDGTPLYEHEDPREGYHQDWNTLIYNLGRNEVHGFLLASGLYWLEHFHLDGLRVDAVASMLYRDYSRKEGEWVPNVHGGRENLEAVTFLQHVNSVVHERCPGAVTIAEESTSWPGVTHPTHQGGLGFDYKWNMGWMHDTLAYMHEDPVFRAHSHNRITFGLVYATSEQFVLPLSHDEVVHGKGSLLGKMPGDRWQKFANLRAYLAFMWSHPGKKLLFMGSEMAQEREWNHDGELAWGSLDDALPRGVWDLVRDLNGVYGSEPALHVADSEGSGFRWVAVDDKDTSVFSYLRFGGIDAAPVLAACNFTPVPRSGYRMGVPHPGVWREILNTDATCYGGSGVGNAGAVTAVEEPSHGFPCSVELTVPPLGALYLRHERAGGK